MALTEKLTAIADAIREKTGEVAALSLEAMVEAINGIKTEPTEPEVKTATITINGSSLTVATFDGSTITTSSVSNGSTIEVPVGQMFVILKTKNSSTNSSSALTSSITATNMKTYTKYNSRQLATTTGYCRDYMFFCVPTSETASATIK